MEPPLFPGRFNLRDIVAIVVGDPNDRLRMEHGRLNAVDTTRIHGAAGDPLDVARGLAGTALHLSDSAKCAWNGPAV